MVIYRCNKCGKEDDEDELCSLGRVHLCWKCHTLFFDWLKESND